MAAILSSFSSVILSLAGLDLFQYLLAASVFMFSVGVTIKAISGRG